MPRNSNARNSRNQTGNQRKSSEGVDDVQQENLHVSKREALEELTLDQLREKYEQAYAIPANEELGEAELVELIIAKEPHGEPPVDSTESFTIDEDGDDEDEIFGNADKDKEYAIPRSITHTREGEETDWQKHVVVRQVQTRIVEGNVVELENTAQIQLYRPETYKRMISEKYFSESKMNVKVLNKPS